MLTPAHPSACLPNIGPAERRKRMRLGIVMLSAAAVLAAWLLAAAAPRPWRLIVAVPLFVGLLGIFQARAQTCVALAARGLRNLDAGMEPIASRDEVSRVKAQARRVNLTTAVAGLVLLAALLAVP
jgi:hypothetical protein